MPIREKNSELMQQVFQLQYEIEQNKRNEHAKMTELSNNYAQLQTINRVKSREVEDLRAQVEQFDQKYSDVQSGRDAFRNQYLEIREINKELNVKIKSM